MQAFLPNTGVHNNGTTATKGTARPSPQPQARQAGCIHVVSYADGNNLDSPVIVLLCTGKQAASPCGAYQATSELRESRNRMRNRTIGIIGSLSAHAYNTPQCMRSVSMPAVPLAAARGSSQLRRLAWRFPAPPPELHLEYPASLLRRRDRVRDRAMCS